VDYITDQLLDGGDLSMPPAPGMDEEAPVVEEAG
jgi:hypothetical protein